MTPNRPPAVLVLAVLHLVFGSLSLLLGMCSGAMVAVNSQGMFPAPAGGAAGQNPPNLAKEMEEFLEREHPYNKALQYSMLALDVGLALLLIVCGVGLLQMYAWARRLSIAYAILMIVSKVGTVVYAATVTVPTMQVFLGQRIPQNPQEAAVFNMMQGVMIFSAYVPLLWIVYPIVMLIVLFLPAVRAAFRGRKVPTDGADVHSVAEDQREE